MSGIPPGYERPIQRTTLQLPASTDVKAYWTWNDRGRNFVLYNIQPMVDIELGHQQGDSSVDLSTCPSRLPYTIDFHAMEQIRHGYGTRRKVQRHPLTASMQSYLRIHTGSTSGVSITTASSSASAVITGPGFSMGSSLPPAKSRPKPKSSPPSKGRRRVKKSSGGGATSSGASEYLELRSTFCTVAMIPHYAGVHTYPAFPRLRFRIYCKH